MWWQTAAQFRLADDFIEPYRHRKPDFGFNGLGELTYYRTYSRLKEDGTNEQWWETVRRVVEGTYRLQERWVVSHHLPWDSAKAQDSAQEMYERMFTMKFLPPGRGLWAMGTALTEERGLFGALQNCGFVSTAAMADDPIEPFAFLMDMSMLGAGIGFDTKGAGLATFVSAQWLDEAPRYSYTIPDTREGWVTSLRLLLRHVWCGDLRPVFDYSQIRAAGEPIKGFGGIAAGPQPLMELHHSILTIANREAATPISVRVIVDIMNLIGKAVVAGNVRRTAEIAFGEATSEEFLNLKNYQLNPERADFGWTSNNSVFAERGQDYTSIAERIRDNGEPGLAWLANMRDFSRMDGTRDAKDWRVDGGNPCVPAGTRILTPAGYQPIDALVGTPVHVWNGENWSKVVPRITGYNQSLVRVKLNDGRELTCTPYHRFILADGSQVEARELQPGDPLLKATMPVVDGVAENTWPEAYTQGFFAGDGWTSERGVRGALLYGEKQALLPELDTDSAPSVLKGDRMWVSFPRLAHDKFMVPTNAHVSTRLAWFAGLLDADGCAVRSDNNVQLQIVSIHRDFLREVQLMLTTLGVNAKVTKASDAGTRLMPDGRGGAAEYDTAPSWRLLVSSSDVRRLTHIGLPVRRLDLSGNTPQRDARRFAMVDCVEPAGTADVVYCFTEDELHQGTFEGIVTGQCLEQSLESWELCTLVETFPGRHESQADYLRTLKFAYLYAKTVTLGPTHWARTNQIMARNRRIGLSQSGIVQTIARLGLDEYRNWCDAAYACVQRYDEVYANWLAVPRSIKTTSIKPSGTTSLLCGATPGMHFPEARTYLRRIRLSRFSALIPPLREAGYHLEPAVGSEDTTLVVAIPVKIEDDVRIVSEVSMWEQLALAAFLQRHWADNQVSCTVTFDPVTEGSQIAHALDYYQFQLKGVSFLPRVAAGAYPQMPYEAISEDEYERRTASLRPLEFGAMREDAEAERFCNNDTCLI